MQSKIKNTGVLKIEIKASHLISTLRDLVLNYRVKVEIFNTNK